MLAFEHPGEAARRLRSQLLLKVDFNCVHLHSNYAKVHLFPSEELQHLELGMTESFLPQREGNKRSERKKTEVQHLLLKKETPHLPLSWQSAGLPFY